MKRNADSVQPNLKRVWTRFERTQRWRARRRPLVLSAVACAALIALAVSLVDEGAPSYSSGEALLGSVSGPRVLVLSDDSTLTLDEDASMEWLVVEDDEVELVQNSGRVVYDIQRHGRRWRIDAGAGSVEVVGTVFTVDRTDGLRVEVHRGAVVVRSAALPEGVERLDAGERVSLPLASANTAQLERADHERVGPFEGSVRSGPREGELPQEAVSPRIGSPQVPSRQVHVEEGRGEQGPSDLHELAPEQTEPVTEQTETVTEPTGASAALLLSADAARRRGERDRALRLLETVVAREDEHSAIAAYTLGTLLETERPRLAARRFADAIRLGIAPPLLQAARSRMERAESVVLREDGDEAP